MCARRCRVGNGGTMANRIIRPLLVVSIALAGCQVSIAPKTVSTVDSRTAPSMRRAPWNGWYTLYQIPADKSVPRTAVQMVHLHKDDALGFSRTRIGRCCGGGG